LFIKQQRVPKGRKSLARGEAPGEENITIISPEGAKEKSLLTRDWFFSSHG